MGSKKLDRLCEAVLPPGFAEVKRLAPGIQRFLEENLPAPVNRGVTLLTITPDEIVVAASSPMQANYLRLHSTEIQQQLRETFKLEQRLKFRTVPDSLLQLDARPDARKPGPVSPQSVAAITRSAEWIEDEELKAALLALAESLKSD